MMNRRDFIRYGGASAAEWGATRLLPAQMQHDSMPDAPGADITLRIAPVIVQLDPNRAISTIGYNGTSPGPVLRMREGKPVTVDVVNETDVPELVHWHGLFIPPEVDGSEEEGTPMVAPHGRHRYQFVPRPAGTRWYHTHAMAGIDLHRGTYTGQFGFVFVEAASNPGRYDQEVFLALRDWEPFLTAEDMDEMEMGAPGPQPEKPATPDMRQNGLEVGYRIFSINDKSLGAGEPIRVKQGQRCPDAHSQCQRHGQPQRGDCRSLIPCGGAGWQPRGVTAVSGSSCPGARRARGCRGGNEPAGDLDSGRHEG